MVNISFLNLRVVKETSGRYDVRKKIQSPNDIFNIAQNVIQMSVPSRGLFNLNTVL